MFQILSKDLRSCSFKPVGAGAARSLAFLSVLTFLLFAGTGLRAATFTVDRTDDAAVSACTVAANDCTLRGAITAANAAGGADTVDFDATVFAGAQTITLTLGELVISTAGSMTISGTGADKLTVSGGGISRVFSISGGATATISGLTITNGNGAGATLTGFGGGVINTGTLTVSACTVSGNQTSVTGNGGGFYNNAGNLTIENSTINSNTGQTGGGGILNFIGGTLVIRSSTITGNQSNSAANGGGGIANVGTATVTSITVASNAAPTGPGGGVTNFASFTSGNSIYADNTANTNPDFSGTLTSNNFNLVENTTGTVIAFAGSRSGKKVASLAANDITGVDPMLGPLQNNAGTTFTMQLLAGSPAIDTGNSFGLTSDQRVIAGRPIDDPATANPIPVVGDLADIGAYEVQAPTAALATIGGRVITSFGRGIGNAIVQLTEQDGSMKFARTNGFGYFRIEGVEVGQTLIFNVASKRYRFSPVFFNLSSVKTEVILVAQ